MLIILILAQKNFCELFQCASIVWVTVFKEENNIDAIFRTVVLISKILIVIL